MACVEKRGVYNYRITVYDGYNDQGRQIKRHKIWKADPGMTDYQIKKELEKQKVLFEQECKTGPKLNGSIKFKEFAEIWFKEYAEINLRQTTLDRYISLKERTYKAFGHMRLDHIRPNDLNKFYVSLYGLEPNKDCTYRIKVDLKAILSNKKLTYKQFADIAQLGIRTVKSASYGEIVSSKTAHKISKALKMDVDKVFKSERKIKEKLAPKTVKHYHSFITSILERAVKWGYINENPSKKVDPPKNDRKQIKCLTTEQAKTFLVNLQNEPLKYKVIFSLLLFTGLRRGELMGLEWSDIDFEKNTISVNRTSLYTVSKGTFTDTTKNDYSLRTINVSPEVMSLLKEYRKEQEELKNALGDQWIDSNRICIQLNGKPMCPNTPYITLQKMLERYNLPRVSLHSLRHTNATIMIESGVDIKTTSTRLGHSQTSTTMNIYVHQIKSANIKAAENISKALAF